MFFMFKHPNDKIEEENKEEKELETKDLAPMASPLTTGHKIAKKIITEEDHNNLKELMEKNLKWSQIIYEQNRKINSKLFWTAFAGWLRLLFIVVPLVLAIIFLPPMLKDIFKSYGDLFGMIGNKEEVANPDKLNSLLESLPLSPEQQEKLKSMLK